MEDIVKKTARHYKLEAAKVAQRCQEVFQDLKEGTPITNRAGLSYVAPTLKTLILLDEEEYLKEKCRIEEWVLEIAPVFTMLDNLRFNYRIGKRLNGTKHMDEHDLLTNNNDNEENP